MSLVNLWCLRFSQMTSSGHQRDIMNIKQKRKAEKLKYCGASVKDKTREKKLLAFMFMAETNRTDTSLVEWIYENFGTGDTVLDYYMLNLMPKHQSKEIVEKLFEKIKTVAKSICSCKNSC